MTDKNTKTVGGVVAQVNPEIKPEPSKLTHAAFAVKVIKALQSAKYPGVHSTWGSTGADGKKRPSFNALFGAYFGLTSEETIAAVNKLVDERVVTKFPVKGGYLIHIYNPNYKKPGKPAPDLSKELAAILK